MTPGPTPTATPAPPPAAWGSLVWTRVKKTFVFSLAEVLAWQGGYVGIGQVWDADDQASVAFFSSADGLSWQVAQRLDPGGDRMPFRLLAVDGGLLAVVRVLGDVPQLWRSSDGRDWQELSSPSWQASWSTGQRLLDLASGPGGLVALGGSSSGPSVLFSANGARTWQAASLSAAPQAEVRRVVSTGHGFVAVGAVGGQQDPNLFEVLGGRSAAWTSPDGLVWQAAEIQASTSADADRLTFTMVYAADEGLLAIASDTTGSIPGSAAQAWASTDGRRWEPLGALGQVVPHGSTAGDGTRMLILDPGDQSPFSETPWAGYRTGWTSIDGRAWTSVSFTGQLMDQESFDGWWLTGQGLVFSGSDRVWLAVAD